MSTLLSLLLISLSWALELPRQISSEEQTEVLRTLGLSSSQKFLSQAYPLGGYQGFEVGLSFESVSLDSVRGLGNGTNSTSLLIPNLSLGKGLYNDLEIFFQLSPQMEASGFGRYGGSLRWSFFESKFLPLTISVVGHGSSSQFRNQLTTRNVGFDLLFGLSFDQFSFFAGGGWASSAGVFYGGPDGLTLSGAQERHKVDHSHITLGGTYHFRPLYVGLSVDRYIETAYSAKLGFIF